MTDSTAQVRDLAERARVASRTLALLTRADKDGALLALALLNNYELPLAAGALAESVWVLVSGCEAGASDVGGVPVVESSPDPNIIEIAQANRATTTMPAAMTMPRRIQ